MPQIRAYALADSTDSSTVIGAVGQTLRLAPAFPRAEQSTFYDTFDWALYRDGGTLVVLDSDDHRDLRWLDLGGGERATRRLGRSGDPSPALPSFARELDDPDWRRALARVIDVRRLLPFARVRNRSTVVPVLDKHEKTVARLVVTDERTSMAPPEGAWRREPARIEARAVRGYERPFARLVGILDGLGLEPIEHDHEVGLALAVSGRRPGGYSNRIAATLHPEMRADEAAKQLLAGLVDTMRTNEDGTRRDLDAEFLHDFRVACRRQRSTLSELRGVFPLSAGAPATRARKELSWLGRYSGPVRDLDVFLLGFDGLAAGLPEDARAALAPVRIYLARRQAESQAALADVLDGSRYLAFVEHWQSFLEAPVPKRPSAPDAGRSIADVAAERLGRIGRKVRKRALRTNPSTPAADLHRLRIAAKRLRYLIELTRSLLVEKRTVRLLKRLKAVQNDLGDWHDLEQQQILVKQAASAMHGERLLPADSALALGQLLAHLASHEAAARLHVTDRVAALAEALAPERLARLIPPVTEEAAS